MKKAGKNIFIAVIILAVAFIYYYVTIPAFNIHSVGTWWFVIGAVVVISILALARKMFRENQKFEIKKGNMGLEIHPGMITKAGFCIAAVLLVILAIGALLSSPIINAKKYQKLMEVQERDFTKDISQVDYNTIPILDKEIGRAHV